MADTHALSTPDFTPVATAVAHWRRRERRLLADLSEWAIGHGRTIDRDLVALVLAAKEGGIAYEPPLHRWTRTGVNRCLSVDVPNWCSLAHVRWPDDVPQALWQLLDFLVAADGLDDDSDPLPELRKPLRCYAGLDADGRDAGDDGGAPPRRFCECYVPYRGPTHGDVRALAAGGERLLRATRRLSD